MKLSHDEVRKIAKLARLRLTEDEVAKFSDQLSDILSHAKMLEEVETDKIEAASQITGLKNVIFKDGVEVCDHAEALLGQSPQQIQDRMIKVKSVF
jgi:aspartyl-tRNA(Asn)/glutamyl-tRNA(Gln) amidotransferase subunit C